MMYIFLLFGLFFLSVLETIQHHFSGSIFAKIKNDRIREWFRSDWTRKAGKTGVRYWLALIDGYHVSKWCMLACFGFASCGFDFMGLGAYTIMIYVVHRAFYGEILKR